MAIRDKVAIIGVGCTKFGEHWEQSAEDMMVEAAYEALDDAGIGPEEIQAAWLGTTTSGRGGPMLAHALKLEYIPVTRVENHCATGTDALRNACYSVAAGACKVALVMGVEKLKDQGFAGLQGHPEIASSEVRVRLMPPIQFALSATRYFHHYGMSYERGKELLAKIAVKNHHYGSLNPKAHLRQKITVEQAVGAPMIAWPLGLYDCCGVTDGAAAAIITRAEIAKTFKDDYVLIRGLSVACGAHQGQLQDGYDYVHFPENVAAAKMAYEEAGIKNPREEVSLALLHDCFTITELITYEDLGLCQRGKASWDVDAGTFGFDGGLPVNTDGGLKSFGHPIGATGLRMIYEAVKQLQGKAGPRQVKDPRMVLTHNLGGAPGRFTSAICVLGRG